MKARARAARLLAMLGSTVDREYALDLIEGVLTEAYDDGATAAIRRRLSLHKLLELSAREVVIDVEAEAS